jgi:hypothetical protein
MIREIQEGEGKWGNHWQCSDWIYQQSIVPNVASQQLSSREGAHIPLPGNLVVMHSRGGQPSGKIPNNLLE